MKFFQKIALVCVLCITAIGFGGCTLPWWKTSDWGTGNNPYDPSKGTTTDVPLPGDTKNDDIVFGRDKANLQKEALATQGVRSIYTPDNDETTDDTILQADRAKYYQNASYQYEIIAKYILHILQGKYGSAVGTETLTYNFYADYSTNGTFYEGKKIRNDSDSTRMTVTLPSVTPQNGNEHLYETHENAINSPVTNVMWSGYDVGLRQIELAKGVGNNPPAVEAYHDDSLHWQITGTDITSYTAMVQLNLMQMALNFVRTQQIALTNPTEISASVARVEINRLAREIDKLGVPQKSAFYDILVDYIENTLIGGNLIERDKQSISYTDLSYIWYNWEKVGSHTDSEGNTVDDYDFVAKGPVYYGMNGSAHTFSSTEIYKFDYHDTVTEIVDAILGVYSGGKLLAEGFVAQYPTYTRVEAIDSQPFDFYYNVDEDLADGERQYISSMEYRNYNSMVLYPDASLDDDRITKYLEALKRGENVEEDDTLYDYDFTKKRWLYDSVNISIESRQEITVDVYMRVHLRGEKQADGTYNSSDFILHLTRMNTDPTKEYSYYPEQDEEFRKKYQDEKGNTKPDIYFDEQKTNERFVMFGDLMMTEKYNEFLKGVQNSFVVGEDNKTAENYRQFYHEQQVLDDKGVDVPQEGDSFHNVFLGKLGSTVSIDTARHLEKSLTFTNFYGEIVDLSDKYLCQDDCDFIEYIFDVQKDETKPSDYDYSFKYSILNYYFWGEYEQEEE